MVVGTLDERFTLITDGNDGKPWTGSAARAYVNPPAEVIPDGDGDGDGDGQDGDGELTIDEQVDRAKANITRLQGELATWEAKLAALLIEQAKAKRAPKATAPKAAPAPAKCTAHGVTHKPGSLAEQRCLRTSQDAAKTAPKTAPKATAKTAPKATPAKVAAVIHAPRGVPAHNTDAPRADCPRCQDAGLVKIPAKASTARRAEITRNRRAKVAA